MLLEQIDLYNFMCYYGHNQFTFSEGLNMVIGDNGYGKSKLFDGFYWAMNDQIFDPERKEFLPTSHFKKELISDRALSEANEDEVVETYVSISFRDPIHNHLYTISRSYQVIQKEDFLKESDKSEEIVKWKEQGFMESRYLENPVEIDRVKRKILPDNIKPYMWFQGEQVESIIDFNESSSLTQAINVLSNISNFDRIKDIAEELENSAHEQYKKQLRKHSKDYDKSKELEKQCEELNEKVKTLKNQEADKKEELGKAEQRAEELINKIEDAQKIRELDQERKQTEEALYNTLQLEKEKQVNLHKKLFTSKWLLKGCEPLFEEFSQMYSSFQSEKLSQIEKKKAKQEAKDELMDTLQARLPENVPEPIYVQRMLDNEICLVCNREAKKDTEPWKRIQELLTKRQQEEKSEQEEEGPIQDFSNELKKLYQNGLTLESLMANIDHDIQNTFQDLADTSNKRKELSQSLEDYNSKINNLMSEANIDVKSAKDLANEYHQHNNYAKRFREELYNIQHQKDKKNQELNDKEQELNSLSTGEFPQWLTEKMEVLTNFKQIAYSTRQRVFEDLVKSLEEEANKHYYEMTKDNFSIRGYIKLKPSTGGNYMPSLVDEEGNQLQQLNTSNIILIKLATIMAIVSARKGSNDTELYTLISDAPTSVFGEDYTIGFCKTVSKVYKQSIIMSKEFYKNKELRDELFRNEEINLGKVYMVTPTIEESERTERNKLATNIKALT